MRAVPASAFVAFVVAVFAPGCGASAAGASAPGADAGDARSDSALDDGAALDGAIDGSRDAPPAHATCGAPPYVTYHLRAGEIRANGSTAPLAGATLGFDLCPDFAQPTDDKGDAFASVGRGVAFSAIVRADGHVSVMTGEELVPVDEAIDEERAIELLPLTGAGASVIPGYSTDAPSFALVIQPDPSNPPPCNAPLDVRLTLGDHPEAQTHYTWPSWPGDTTEVIGGVSAGPVVLFSGLVGAEVTDVRGTHPHCTVTVGPPSHQTGRFHLRPGVWTVGNVRL